MKKLLMMLAMAFLLTNTQINLSMEESSETLWKSAILRASNQTFNFSADDKDNIKQLMKTIDVNIPFSDDGKLPIEAATTRPLLLELLLDGGADANAIDNTNFKNTVLHYLIYVIGGKVPDLKKMTSYLTKPSPGMSIAYYESAYKMIYEPIEILMQSLKLICSKQHVNLNIKNAYGKTVWDLAEASALPNILTILRKCEANKPGSSKG